MGTLLPAILWTVVVLSASSEPLSSAHTGSILEAIVRALRVPVTQHQFDVLHFLIRKAAHVTEYGILGFFWLRAIRRDARFRWRDALIAIAIAAVIATADEIHQIFVPQRTPSPYDVMLDIAGATLVQCGLWMRMLLFVPS